MLCLSCWACGLLFEGLGERISAGASHLKIHYEETVIRDPFRQLMRSGEALPLHRRHESTGAPRTGVLEYRASSLRPNLRRYRLSVPARQREEIGLGIVTANPRASFDWDWKASVQFG